MAFSFILFVILSTVNKPPRKKKLSMDIDRTFKCGGFRRYGCTFEMKFVKPAENDDCAVYQSGVHYHADPKQSISGIPQHVKKHLIEGSRIVLNPLKFIASYPEFSPTVYTQT